MVAKFVCLCGGVVVVVVIVVVLAFSVFAFDLDEGYGVTDCGIKWGECSVARGLSAALAMLMTEYGCSSVSCVCGFFIES